MCDFARWAHKQSWNCLIKSSFIGSEQTMITVQTNFVEKIFGYLIFSSRQSNLQLRYSFDYRIRKIEDVYNKKWGCIIQVNILGCVYNYIVNLKHSFRFYGNFPTKLKNKCFMTHCPYVENYFFSIRFECVYRTSSVYFTINQMEIWIYHPLKL